ncbi:hypothetical protein WR25_11755 isoform C [Diploscapter pachys]|nr:hypothetical protein WR25_11755 isoform C [Diploscapter pachys]
MAEPDDESEEDYEDAEAATTEKIAWEKSSTRKILKTPDSDAIRKKATTTQNPNFFKISENDADDEVQRQIQRMQVPETSRTTSSITTTTTTTTAPSTPLTTVTEPETTSTTQIVTTAQTSTVPITSSEEIVVTAATQQLETSTEQQQQQVEAAGKASEFSISDSDFERRFTTNDDFGSEEEKNKSNEQMNVKPELHIKHDFGNNIQRIDFDSNTGIVLPILPTQPPTSGIVITEEISAMQPTAPAKLFKVVQPSVPMTAPRLPFGFSPKSPEVEKVYDSKSVQPQKQVIAATEQQESAEIVEAIQTTTTRKPRKPKLKKHKLGKNKRRKLSRRLKMLNNKIKVSEIALLPTELAFNLPESEGRKVLPLTTIATISERKVNRTLEKIDRLLEKIETEGVHSNTPVMNQSQQLYEETLEIEKRLSELQKEVNKSKKKMEKAKAPLPSVDVVEGDTARALSWMIANMSKTVEDNPSVSVVDMIPLERVVDTPAFRLQSRTQNGVNSQNVIVALKQENDSVNLIRRNIPMMLQIKYKDEDEVL